MCCTLTVNEVESNDIISVQVCDIAYTKDGAGFSSIYTVVTTPINKVIQTTAEMASLTGNMIVPVVLKDGSTAGINKEFVYRIFENADGTATIIIKGETKFETQDLFSTIQPLFSDAGGDPGPAHGQTLYVSVTGDNSTAEKGNLQKPWADPWTARSAAVSGDTIIIFSGTYASADGNLFAAGVSYRGEGTVILDITGGQILSPNANDALCHISGIDTINFSGSGRAIQIFSNDNLSLRLQVRELNLSNTGEKFYMGRINNTVLIEVDDLNVSDANFLVRADSSNTNPNWTFRFGEIGYTVNVDVAVELRPISSGTIRFFCERLLFSSVNSSSYFFDVSTLDQSQVYVSVTRASNGGDGYLARFDEARAFDNGSLVYFHTNYFSTGGSMFLNGGWTGASSGGIILRGSAHLQENTSRAAIFDGMSNVTNDIFYYINMDIKCTGNSGPAIRISTGVNAKITGRYSRTAAAPVIDCQGLAPVAGKELVLSNAVIRGDLTASGILGNLAGSVLRTHDLFDQFVGNPANITITPLHIPT
jgi:hypothetical protein